MLEILQKVLSPAQAEEGRLLGPNLSQQVWVVAIHSPHVCSRLLLLGEQVVLGAQRGAALAVARLVRVRVRVRVRG